MALKEIRNEIMKLIDELLKYDKKDSTINSLIGGGGDNNIKIKNVSDNLIDKLLNITTIKNNSIDDNNKIKIIKY